MARISLDANILVYAVDTSDSARHRVARRIISSAAQRDCVLALQALSEFYFVVTRKGKLAAEEAQVQVAALRELFALALPSGRTLDRAIETSQRHQLAFWDAMLLVVAREAGVSILLSEDLHDGQVIEGLRCVNPFAKSAAELARLLG